MPELMSTTYSPDEIANRTGRSIHTIYRHLRNGKLDGEKFAGEWVVTDEALQEWLPTPLYEDAFANGEGE